MHLVAFRRFCAQADDETKEYDEEVGSYGIWEDSVEDSLSPGQAHLVVVSSALCCRSSLMRTSSLMWTHPCLRLSGAAGNAYLRQVIRGVASDHAHALCAAAVTCG